MSTIKITELPELFAFNSNTSNTVLVGVDVANDTTIKVTLDTVIGRITSNVVSLQFSDLTTMSSAPATLGYSQAAFATANGATSNVAYLSGALTSANAVIANNTSNIASNRVYASAAFAEANNNLVIINYLGGALNTTNANTIALQSLTANNSANILTLQGLTSNNSSNIIALQAYSNAAFAKANAALANVSGAIFGGDLTISGNTYTNGDIVMMKGFKYTPNVHGAITTLTIDFARDSFHYANGAGGLVVTLTNFQRGKEVTLWFTNNSGSPQSVVHGALANNSTVNATSFNMPANSTAYLRYFSIDSTLANTFVAATHA